ncbi:MAG: DUF6364 family protein [Cyclobacteriaceae bacterium]
MDAKVTLKLDKKIVEEAKKYASSKNRSLSAIVEAYLIDLIAQQEADKFEEVEISPFVKSMSSGKSLPADLDYKAEYGQHLKEKHQ